MISRKSRKKTKNIVKMDKSVNTHPLISVILPVKDGEKYLAQSIESVMNQDFDSIELRGAIDIYIIAKIFWRLVRAR